MDTRILGTDGIDEAAAILRRGGLVVFPTETVYGLGGSALRADSAMRIFAAKGRPSDNPLIVHIPDIARLETVVERWDPISWMLAEAFWPGPLTLVLPKHPAIPAEVTAGLGTVAVRVPLDPLARDLLRLADVPVAAPSANRSGRPSPTAGWMARREMEGRVDAILMGPDTRIGLESTIVWVSERGVHVLRPGSIGPAQIREVLRAAGLPRVPVLLKNGADSGTPPSSPGTKYRHYSPDARVITYTKIQELREIDATNAAILTTHRYRSIPQAARAARVHVYEDLTEYARQLYRDLVSLDQEGIRTIYLYLPAGSSLRADGLGHALVDRIRRAAGIH